MQEKPDGATVPATAGPLAPMAAPDALPPDPEIDRLFEKAVAENSRRLLGIARGIIGNRALPEDVVQQAVMNLYQHRARYDWREPGGLLRRAVVNEALRLLRQPRMTAVEEDYHGATSAPPEAGLEQRETVIQVRKAIDRLPENFKAALVLCEYEQMPYAQIAESLGASIPQVKTWDLPRKTAIGRDAEGLCQSGKVGSSYFEILTPVLGYSEEPDLLTLDPAPRSTSGPASLRESSVLKWLVLGFERRAYLPDMEAREGEPMQNVET